MIKLEKPTDNVKDVFSDCIINLSNKELKERLTLCIDDIVACTLDYEEKVSNGKVHLMKAHNQLRGLSKEDLIKVYERKLAKKNQPGRKYYDKYMSIPDYGVCPYCGQRIVSTLDHYLAKTKYISLVVTPTNLVPACQDCNKLKLDKEYKNVAETILNPYFDNIGEEVWLTARIIQNGKDDFIMIYEVTKPTAWDKELYERVRNHFKVFNLNKLYSSHAGRELVGVKRKLLSLYRKAGIESVIKDLNENIEAYSYNLNSWQIAMYRELLLNKWFCEEWLQLNK